MTLPDDKTMNINRRGTELAQAWQRANERREQAKAEWRRAETDTNNAAYVLTKWLKPDDAKPGEKFCFWFGDDLFQVEVGQRLEGGEGDAPQERDLLTIRPRGRK